MTTHLHIPDPHAHPEHSNMRFNLLGKLILDLKPDVVICAGDLFDMESLNSFDSASRKAWTKTSYTKDITVGIDAQERMFWPMRKAKRRMPRRVFNMGNHEAPRIERWLGTETIMEGSVGVSDMDLDYYWDDVVPFLEPIIIDGIAYCHYWVSGVMGRAISGTRPASQILRKEHMSCTSGHSHTLDFAQEHTASGNRIQALVNGCFVDYDSPWNNKQSSSMWHSGVAIKRNVDEGQYDLQLVSMASLYKEYGDAK